MIQHLQISAMMGRPLMSESLQYYYNEFRAGFCQKFGVAYMSSLWNHSTEIQIKVAKVADETKCLQQCCHTVPHLKPLQI